MVIGYARVSTNEQNMDLQLDSLKSYNCDKIFKENASSRGELKERDKAISILDAGDTFVVWRLDRLARSTVELIKLVQLLDDRGVHFVSIRDKIDTSSAVGRFQLAVFAAVAEFERDLIRERTLAGLASARARGRVGGRPKGMSKETISKCQAVDGLVEVGQSVEAACRLYKLGKATYYKWRAAQADNPCKCEG